MSNKLKEIKDQEFIKQNIQIDNKNFINCTFDQCTLIYSGLGPIGLNGCTFKNTNWSFDKYASNTMGFLKAMYHNMGSEGRSMVEGTFDRIRAKETDSGEISNRSAETDLPEKLGEYQRRVAQINNFVIIEYSKRPVFQYMHDVSEEDINNNLLFDVKEYSMYNAITKMKDKVLNYLTQQFNKE